MRWRSLNKSEVQADESWDRVTKAGKVRAAFFVHCGMLWDWFAMHTFECMMAKGSSTKQQHPQHTRNIHFLPWPRYPVVYVQWRGVTCVFLDDPLWDHCTRPSIPMPVGIQQPNWLWRGSMKLFNAHGYSSTNSTFFGPSAHVTRKHPGPRITPSNSVEKHFKFAFPKEASRKQSAEHRGSNRNWRICDYFVTVHWCEAKPPKSNSMQLVSIVTMPVYSYMSSHVIFERAAKFFVPKVPISWMLSFYQRFVIVFSLFIVWQGIDALSFYKGLKYIEVNRINLHRFAKNQPMHLNDTSCSESTRGKLKMLEIQCNICSLFITKHVLAARSFSKWYIAICCTRHGQSGLVKS